MSELGSATVQGWKGELEWEDVWAAPSSDYESHETITWQDLQNRTVREYRKQSRASMDELADRMLIEEIRARQRDFKAVRTGAGDSKIQIWSEE